LRITFHCSATLTLEVIAATELQCQAELFARYDLVTLDALGREAQATLGNALLSTQHLYDRANARLTEIQSGPPAQGTSLQWYGYGWDKVGNLTQRVDKNQSDLTEDFDYDALNRLDLVQLNSVTTLDPVYDDDGNLDNKTEQGLYTYLASRPHAVSQTNISCGLCCTITRNYGYDANGNMTNRDGAAITWTSFNKPKVINLTGSNCSGDCTTFTYGPDRRPLKQVVKKGGATTTLYYIGPHFEKEIGATTEYRSHALVNGQRFYTQLESSSNWVAYYNLRDHLGSVDKQALTVGSGTDPLAYSFDAFGKRRNTNWTPDNSDALQTADSWNHRGYTDHEQLDNVRLIHMGGRVYDPKLGRFISVDPLFDNLRMPQSLNPYSYVANNPLSLTDPTGMGIGSFFKRTVKKVVSLHMRLIDHTVSVHRRALRNQYVQIAGAAVAAYYTAGAVQSWVATAADEFAVAGTGAAAFEAGSTLALSAPQASVIGGVAGGAVGGAIATGNAKGAFWGAVSGGAFAGVNVAFGGQYSAGRVLADATVGGATSAAQGGDFWQGFGTSGSFSALTWGALEMRDAMVAQSRLYTDPNTGVQPNAAGISGGVGGDLFKLGGCRFPCTGSPFGGIQGGPGKFLGIAYPPGGFLDQLVETFGGPHDFLNNPVFYDALGNQRWGRLGNAILSPVNLGNIAVAAPFAGASVIPPYAYSGFVDSD